MADRYPNRPSPADDYRGGDQHGSGGDNDPLAELARLIGQTDPFGATPTPARPSPPTPRAALPPLPYQPVQPQYQPPQLPQPQPPQATQYQQYEPSQPQYEPSYEDEESEPPPGPPQWMQRANIHRQAVEDRQTQPVHEPEYEDYADEQPSAVHPLHRYPAPAQQDDYQQQEHAYSEQGGQADPSRYDDALYGQIENGAHDFQREPAYPDDPYAYQDGYEDEQEDRPKRRGGMMTVAAVLALAVIGTGAAFAYRSYVGSPRSGEPPIIKADNSPTKVMPAPSDSSGKTLDRMPAGDGGEKLVPREEAPVDVNSRAAGPRVVFPSLNQNANPPTAASTSPGAPLQAGAAPSNGTLPNNEPRRIKTFSVHGDQPDTAAAPATSAPPAGAQKQALAAKQPQFVPPRGQPLAANAPLSLSPDSAQASLPPSAPESRTRSAAAAPTQAAPADAAPAAEGRFLVQISSQKTEADAQASYRAAQKKYPDQLGSRSPVIKRADLGGDKGTVYRAMVGPFASRDEAKRFCTSYQGAGGQCYVP
jgi:hypothetical protein